MRRKDMSGIITKKNSGINWSSMGLQPRSQIIVWFLIALIFLISLLDLTGWIFNIPVLKSIDPRWISMKIISAICLIFSTASVILVQTGSSDRIKIIVARILATFTILVGAITIFDFLDSIITGHEIALYRVPGFSLFISPLNRMAFLAAAIFVVIGTAILLLSLKNYKTDYIAHIIIYPAALASYFVPVSYILGVNTMYELLSTPVALNTGIALTLLCLVIFMVRPHTRIMSVFTNNNTGGIMARRLLPGMIALPVIIAWLRIYGEHYNLFESEVGVAIVAFTYTICLVSLVWFSARSVNQIDHKRRQYEEALIESRIVEAKRADDLLLANEQLRKAQEDLIRSESNLRAILDATQESIYMFDKEGKFVVSNLTGANRLNLTLPEVIGHHFSEFMSSDMAKERSLNIDKVFDSGKSFQFEDERNGMIFNHNFYPVFENDRVTRVVTYSQEITERKKAENDLIQS
jgi:PAS domain S-box-containing protein